MSLTQTGADWSLFKDEDLLSLRICDLKLDLESSPLKESIDQLYIELDKKNLNLRPKIYLGDEWFSPEGVVAISVPFYLAHPRLTALEEQMMLEVEGGDPDYFLKLLRHEMGHCFDHAFRFSRRKKWHDVFGSPDQEYSPETYRPRRYSRSFVNNLNNGYAQAHPDEDFAETFAVWLSPERNWREEYRHWTAALKKLQYIEKLAKEVKEKRVESIKTYLPCSASRMKTTLKAYYQKRRRENAQDYPDFYDEDLLKIFGSSSPSQMSTTKPQQFASQFMNKNKKEIISSVAHWTGEKKYAVAQLIKRLTLRCEELHLTTVREQASLNLELAAYLATLVTHYLLTGKFKRGG